MSSLALTSGYYYICTLYCTPDKYYCFAYYNYADIKKMIKHKLVTELILNSYIKPDLICELYVARKMLYNPFLLLVNHYYFLLTLVYLDLYSLLLIATCQEYKY